MDIDVTAYPEGYEHVRDQELNFLPDDPEVRELFMDSMLMWMLQW